MASIRKVNTRPELALRRGLWRHGVRGWRCHVRTVPGTPDLVFARWRVAIHVDGVWWHGHPDYLPAGRRGPYWDRKIARNRERDRVVDAALRQQGWISLRVWDLDVLRDLGATVALVVSTLRSRGWER